VDSEDSTPNQYEYLRATLQDRDITAKDLDNAMEQYLKDAEISGAGKG
jgi:hypothetical protein